MNDVEKQEKKQETTQNQVSNTTIHRRIEAHVNKLHDFVRSLDLRIQAIEFESDKKKAIDKAIAAKLGKVKQQWSLEEQVSQEQAAQQKQPLRAGQKCRGGQ